MKLSRRKLRSLIESTIKEVDGLVPTDKASQVAASALSDKAKDVRAEYDTNDGLLPGTKGAKALGEYFEMLYKKVKSLGGPVPTEPKQLAQDTGGMAAEFQRTMKRLNWYGEELSEKSVELAETMVGLARAKTASDIMGLHYNAEDKNKLTIQFHQYLIAAAMGKMKIRGY